MTDTRRRRRIRRHRQQPRHTHPTADTAASPPTATRSTSPSTPTATSSWPRSATAQTAGLPSPPRRVQPLGYMSLYHGEDEAIADMQRQLVGTLDAPVRTDPMPTAAPRICARCGRPAPKGQPCQCRPARRQHQPGEHQAMAQFWRGQVENQPDLQADGCRHVATEVDHRTPLAEGASLPVRQRDQLLRRAP